MRGGAMVDTGAYYGSVSLTPWKMNERVPRGTDMEDELAPSSSGQGLKEARSIPALIARHDEAAGEIGKWEEVADSANGGKIWREEEEYALKGMDVVEPSSRAWSLFIARQMGKTPVCFGPTSFSITLHERP
jgi:hypothetical protein